MYIGFFAFNIAITIFFSYNCSMDTYFEKKIIYNQISFRYAKGKSITDGNEIHPYHEILFYIDGGGKFLSEDYEEALSGGTLLIIPKNSYHQFIIPNQENYTRLVLNFPDTHGISISLNKIKVIHCINGNIKFVLQRMCDALYNEQNDFTDGMLYGAFLMLMYEISISKQNLMSPKLRENNELISKCIQYIDANFTSDISVKKIATEMNVSTSTLFQCFKTQLGISIYKYITEKRLIYAHSLISQNMLPTKIYLECGYNDYATFYKAYLKMFHHPPSLDK